MNSQEHNGFSVLRALLAPMQRRYDVLTTYEIRHGSSLGESPCLVNGVVAVTLVMVSGLALLSPCVGVCAAPLFIFWVYSIAARWRLVWSSASRLASAISARRQTGDWDLIRLIPMPKTQWLHTQLVAMGWQVWPLLKGLIITQWGIATVFFMLLLAETSASSRYCYAEPCLQRMPGLSFFLAGLPLLAMWVAVPLMEAGLVASMSGLVSSYINRPGFAIAASFVGALVMRVILGLAGWVIMYLLYSELAVKSDYSWDRSRPPVLPSFIELAGIAVFWEWLPALGLGEISTHRAFSSIEHTGLYAVVFGTIFLSYIMIPFGLIHVFFKWTAWRLDRE